MTTPRFDKDALKRQIPIEEVIAADHPLKQKSPRLLVGAADDCDSLMVEVDKQMFSWWRPGWHGDVFVYLMETRNIDFREALRILAEFRSACPDIPPPKAFKQYDEKPKPVIDPTLPDRLHNNLLDNTVALDYLINRGIGFDDITRYKLGFQSNYLGQGDIIAIPVYDGEKLMNMRFRRMVDSKQSKLPRYGYMLTGHGAQLYNAALLDQKRDTVYIVEGEFKAITANTFDLPSVGIMGASSMKTEWFGRFKSARRVIVALDNDQRPFELPWVKGLAAAHGNVRVIQLYDKIDDLLLSGGASFVLSASESAQKVIPDESQKQPRYG